MVFHFSSPQLSSPNLISHPAMKTLLSLTLTTAVILSSSFAALANDAAKSVSPDDALSKLQEGNRRFSTSRKSEGKPTATRRTETAQSQHPFAIIVGCADSRTSPELVFDQNIGDLFVIRTAGNLVDDYALGSIEYAVEHLGSRLIVVLGHERCGAVKAASQTATAPGHINALVRDIQPAIQAAKEKGGDSLDVAIDANARLVADKIRKESNLGELAKSVRVISAVYDLDTGVVSFAK